MSKNKIISASIEVFAEFGYHKASMDEIALRANVAKGTLYYHFSSKAELFKTIVMNAFNDLIDRVITDLKSDFNSEELIKRIIRHNTDLFLESTDFVQIIYNELSNGIEQEVLDELKKIKVEYLNFITNILKEGIEGGEVELKVDCNLASSAIFGIIWSTLEYFVSESSSVSRDYIEGFIYQVITSGIFINLDNS